MQLYKTKQNMQGEKTTCLIQLQKSLLLLLLLQIALLDRL
jgi:hypothetical protein